MDEEGKGHSLPALLCSPVHGPPSGILFLIKKKKNLFLGELVFLLYTPKGFVLRMTETERMVPHSQPPNPNFPVLQNPAMSFLPWESFLYPLLVGDNSSLRVQPGPLP